MQTESWFFFEISGGEFLSHSRHPRRRADSCPHSTERHPTFLSRESQSGERLPSSSSSTNAFRWKAISPGLGEGLKPPFPSTSRRFQLSYSWSWDGKDSAAPGPQPGTAALTALMNLLRRAVTVATGLQTHSINLLPLCNQYSLAPDHSCALPGSFNRSFRPTGFLKGTNGLSSR